MERPACPGLIVLAQSRSEHSRAHSVAERSGGLSHPAGSLTHELGRHFQSHRTRRKNLRAAGPEKTEIELNLLLTRLTILAWSVP